MSNGKTLLGLAAIAAALWTGNWAIQKASRGELAEEIARVTPGIQDPRENDLHHVQNFKHRTRNGTLLEVENGIATILYRTPSGNMIKGFDKNGDRELDLVRVAIRGTYEGGRLKGERVFTVRKAGSHSQAEEYNDAQNRYDEAYEDATKKYLFVLK